MSYLSKAWMSAVGGHIVWGELDRIKAAYAGRAYHSMSHVEQVLRAIRHPLRHQLVAAFYHDIKPDEDDSISDFVGSPVAALLEPWEVVRVVACIDATKPILLKHMLAPDTLAFRDADRKVLAGAPHVYWSYTQALRQEYKDVSDEQWREGRSEFLRSVLAEEHIFWTLPLYYDLQARGNINRELSELHP